MNVESKLSTLPQRDAYVLGEPKIVHVIPNLGLVRVKDGVSFGAETIKDLGIPAKTITVPSNKLYPVAVIYDVRQKKAGMRRIAPVGYSFLNSYQHLVFCSISEIPRYIDDIVSLGDSPKVKLGLELEFTTTVNKLFCAFPSEIDSLNRGFRTRENTIKMLPSSQIIPAYIKILTNTDLTFLYKQLNAAYFENKLCNSVKVHWKSGGIAYTELSIAPENNILNSPAIVGYATSDVDIYLSRNFMLRYPQLFYEIFLHEMIHAFGVPYTHNSFFEHWVDVLNNTNTELEVLSVDVSDASRKGKWRSIALNKSLSVTEAIQISCPNCGRVLRPAQRNVYGCSCGHQISFRGD